MNYTAYQIQDALKNQGVEPELAQQIAWSIGDQRLDEGQTENLYKQLGVHGAKLPEGSEGSQGSNFITNLAEGIGGTLGGLAIKRAPILGAMIGGSLGNYAGMEALGGDKYYDRATTPQVLADMGGSWLGGSAGGAIAGGIGRALAGRAAGGTLGSVLGPIGSVAGAALGGWLLPKLLPDGSKSVAEDDGESGGGWGTLGAAAAVPLAYKAARRFAPGFMNPLAKKAREGAKWLGGEPLQKAYTVYKDRPELPEDASLWQRTKHTMGKPFEEAEYLGKGGEELTYQIAQRLMGNSE